MSELFRQIDVQSIEALESSPASTLFNCPRSRSLLRTRNSTASSTSGAASHLAWRETDAAAEDVVLDDDGGDGEIAAVARSLVLSSKSSSTCVAAVAAATAIGEAGDFDRVHVIVGRGERDGAIARLFRSFPQLPEKASSDKIVPEKNQREKKMRNEKHKTSSEGKKERVPTLSLSVSGIMAPPDQDSNAPDAAPPVLDLLAALQRRAWTEAVDAAATMIASASSSSFPAPTTMETRSSSSCHPSIPPLFAPRFARAALRGQLPASG